MWYKARHYWLCLDGWWLLSIRGSSQPIVHHFLTSPAISVMYPRFFEHARRDFRRSHAHVPAVRLFTLTALIIRFVSASVHWTHWKFLTWAGRWARVVLLGRRADHGERQWWVSVWIWDSDAFVASVASKRSGVVCQRGGVFYYSGRHWSMNALCLLMLALVTIVRNVVGDTAIEFVGRHGIMCHTNASRACRFHLWGNRAGKKLAWVEDHNLFVERIHR